MMHKKKVGRNPRRLVIALALGLGFTAGCKVLAGRPARFVPNEVIVVGTLGAGHLDNPGYDLERLELLLRELDPHRVLCEIPPDRFDLVWREYSRTREIDDERVNAFPEITGALLPLALEGRLGLVPVSAWTPEVEARRARLLEQWKTTRPDDTRRVERSRSKAQERITAEGLSSDPLLVNSERYDQIVAEGMIPYELLFDRDLGSAGWQESNIAHASLIKTHLDGCRGEGLRIVVLFSAWNRYQLLKFLAQRTDIELLDLEAALERGSSRP